MKPYMNAKFLISAEKLSQCPDYTLPEFPLLGRSNVGKSSFINGLSNNKRLAKTSNVPGKTRLINFFNFSEEFMIADLPGYGYAKAPETLVKQWQQILKTYLKGRPNLRRVFLMIDSRHGFKKDDLDIMKMLDEAAVPYQIILTKIDKISVSELTKVTDRISTEIKKHAAALNDIIATSSEKKIGLDIFKAEICSLM